MINQKYQEALNHLQNQFNALYITCSKLGEENPVEHLKFRIKSKESIKDKLNRLKEKSTDINKELKYNFSEASLDSNLSDIVGVRIVCPFLSDVEKVIKIIHKTKTDMGIEIMEEKDYISHPKANGYSSYHMKIVVSVPINGVIEKVKAEIQIRTITMDMLNSLEHKIYYKKDINLPEEMRDKLNQITRFCNLVDLRLNKSLKQISKKFETKPISRQLPDFMETQEFSDFLSAHQKGLNALNEMFKNFTHIYYQKEQNPIEHIKIRVKSKERIAEKLSRKNLPITMENIENNIHDIAGLRIVCSFKSDVEEMLQMIKETLLNENYPLEIMEEQDYNQNPKESGYTSYHLLVKIPVYNQNNKRYIKVEIQIRTIAQEMWAILQERLCYQKESDRKIEEELKEMSNILSDVDNTMNEMIKQSILLQKESGQKKKKERKLHI